MTDYEKWLKQAFAPDTRTARPFTNNPPPSDMHPSIYIRLPNEAERFIERYATPDSSMKYAIVVVYDDPGFYRDGKMVIKLELFGEVAYVAGEWGDPEFVRQFVREKEQQLSHARNLQIGL